MRASYVKQHGRIYIYVLYANIDMTTLKIYTKEVDYLRTVVFCYLFFFL